MAFIYDLSDTWNNAGISFSGIKINVTDSASAAGSKLLDLQIGSASKFTVGKTGTVTATGLIESTVGGFRFPDGTTQTTKATVNSVSGTGTVNGITLTGTVTDSGSLTLGGTLGNIANSQLTNSAITINGTSTALGGSISVGTVTSVSGTGTVSGLSLTGSVTTTGSLTLGGTLVLTSDQVTDALGYTPYNATNPAGYTTNVGTVTSVAGTGTVNGLTLTGSITTSGSLTLGGTLVLTSGQVTDGLGYTPYDATNPTGYITASALTPYLTSATAAITYQPLDGDLTAIAALAGTAGLVRKTAANTYALDTAVYITGISSGDVTTALGYTPYNATNPAGYTTNVGTVTSVAALTLGTSGTDLASSVANGTTTPVITLNVPTASATNRGALSSSDWSTFNAKQAALVSGTNIKTVGGASLLGSGDVGTIGLAYGGTGATTDSGARTALGLGTAAVLNSGVAGGVATLDGSGTVPTSQLPGAVLGGLNYQGTWNASTNVPTLASSVGSKGYYYVVSVAGSTNLDGITDWKIGDWAVYDGSAWQKVDNTDAVSSVNGFTGAVVLTTSDVAQGTNLYFTQAAARGSVSAGTGISYDSGTGVITNSAPDQTVALTGAGTTVVTGTYPNFTVTSNDSAIGTVTSVGGTGTVSGLTLTGTVTTSGDLTLGGTLAVTPSNFASQTANTVLAAPNGAAGVPTFRAIVAADIPTLNQNTTGTASNVTGTVAVANGGTGATSLTSGYLLKGNGTSAVSASVVYDTGTNVGIGTTSPGAKLDVLVGDGAEATKLRGATGRMRIRPYVDATNGSFIDAVNTAENAYIPLSLAGSSIRLTTNGGLAATVDTSGNVGIGTASPGALLDVNGVGRFGSLASKISVGLNGDSISMNGDLYIQTSTANPLIFRTNFAEAMRINSSGQVGIGTSSPAAALDVAKSTGNFILRDGTTANASIFMTATGTSYAEIQAAKFGINFDMPLVFQRQGGNVGIGISTPAERLDVAGNAKITSGSSFYWGDATAQITAVNAGAMRFLVGNGGEKVRIDSSGNVGINTSTPATTLEVYGGLMGGSENRQTHPNASAAGGFKAQWNFGGGTAETDFYNLFNSASESFRFYQSTGSGTAQLLYSMQSSTHILYTGGTERMRINSSGNVGIGTTSPTTSLQIGDLSVADATYQGRVKLEDASTSLQTIGGLEFATSSFGAGYGWKINSIDGGGGVHLVFGTRQNSATWTETMRLDGSGNVGIGTASPSAKLHVFGDTFFVNTVAGRGFQLKTIASSNGRSDNSVQYSAGDASSAEHIWGYGGAASFTERMRIDGSGNVGIGTSSPSQKLDIGGGGNLIFSGASTGDQFIRVGSGRSGNGYSFIDLQGDTTYSNGLRLIRTNGGANASSNIEHRGTGALSLITQEAGPITFLTSATERARIDTSGNLLVGTTVTTATQTGVKIIPALGGQVGYIDISHANGTAAGNGYVAFYYNATTIGSITQSGTTAVLYNTTSDVRLKDNITDADDAASLIDAIQVRKFDWKADGSHQRYGFVAQELVTVAPEAVSQPADPDDMMGVDYSKLVPMLVKELQSLRARVAQLEGN